MITKGQHRGHCQVCGRIQVVLPSGNIAKHGYRVAGFHFYPEMIDTVNQIRGLLVARDVIKARPVIK